MSKSNAKSNIVRRAAAPLLIALIALFSLAPAFSNGIVTPVEIRVPLSMTAGQNVAVQVTLSEPGPVVLTSSPAGVVSYSTTITSSSATIAVPVNSSASGPVTFILSSNGQGQKIDVGNVEEPEMDQ